MPETNEYPMTVVELDALAVLAAGMACTSPRTASDRARGIHTINGRCAATLCGMGYARRVAQWDAVEITDLGRAALDALA